MENTETVKKRSVTKAKPEGFQEMESLAKAICDGKGQPYYEWLHQKHQALVLEFTLHNKAQIMSLVAKEGEARG